MERWGGGGWGHLESARTLSTCGSLKFSAWMSVLISLVLQQEGSVGMGRVLSDEEGEEASRSC
jgi:hypothetical protein